MIDDDEADAEIRSRARRISQEYKESGGIEVWQDHKIGGETVYSAVLWGSLTDGQGPDDSSDKPRFVASLKLLHDAYLYGSPADPSYGYRFPIQRGYKGFVGIISHEFGHFDKQSMVIKNQGGNWIESPDKENRADDWRYLLMKRRYNL